MASGTRLDRAVRRLLPGRPDLERWQYLAAVLGVVGVLVAAGAAALRTLGLLVHRAREQRIGIAPLDYPEHELLLAGLDALWQLPWRALSALGSSHPGLQACAWGLLLFSAAILLHARSRRRRPRAPSPLPTLVVASLAAVLLLAGVAFATIVVRARNLERPGAADQAFCANLPSGNWTDAAASETCSWLTNEGPVNQERRESLGGLWPWLAAAILGTAFALHRAGDPQRATWRRWRFAVAAVLGLAGLLVLRLLPVAHAYATWGLEYPQVRLLDRGGCEPPRDLLAAEARGVCCAHDVTDAAVSDGVQILRVVGTGCPAALQGTLRVSDRCSVQQPGGPRVLGQGCG